MSYTNTILGQMLQIFPRLESQRLLKDTGAEFHALGFTS